ncbi:hypothetical protein FA13DRAFT_1785959 [Coprinellus micaceus]|uniref:Uncharacterized protein n=1 Tax=Coprinellus micaceus TaxID=71717 RepID=A0A4Y7TW13_COPMI|nr:hypothetical protein FA13DRAFT_1785959 [Coprinellus micaceus]
MGNYDRPNVVYRSYIITHAKYNQMTKKIPSYKQLVLSDRGEHSHHFCYSWWKNYVLDETLRKRAPKLKRAPPGIDPSHMMFLLGCFEFENRRQVEDPNHPDAKHLPETDRDRERLEKFNKFFRNRRARNMKSEDFEWVY